MDAESDDGAHQLTAIVFVGSVFSPHYARAHRRGPVAASEHVALNVALYGKKRAWAFVETAEDPRQITAEELPVGASRVRQAHDALWLEVNAPRGLGQPPLVGRIRLTMDVPGSPRAFRLDPSGQHRWWPRAPRSRVEVEFPALGVCWRGRAYHDVNWGDEPLAHGFRSWQWMRQIGTGTTRVDYVAELAAGKAGRALHLAFDDAGKISREPHQTLAPLGRSGWGIWRAAGKAWRLARTLEDTPFYARSLLRRASAGGAEVAIHEALDMRRWQRGWVRFLLPFRLLRLRRPASRPAPRPDAATQATTPAPQ